MNKRQAKEYRATASRIVESYGATFSEEFHTGSRWYKLNGAEVTVLDGWVSIRLPQHMIAGASVTHHDTPNPYSGKWNIHTDTPEMDELQRRLEWIAKQ